MVKWQIWLLLATTKCRCSKSSFHLDLAFVNDAPKLPILFWDYICAKKGWTFFNQCRLAKTALAFQTTIKTSAWDDCFGTVGFGGSTLKCQGLISSYQNTLHVRFNLTQRKMLYMRCESFPRAFCKLHYF